MNGFECVECGYDSVKWLGRCPACGSWDSIVERASFSAADKSGDSEELMSCEPVALKDISSEGLEKISSGLRGFDLLLGGGFVAGEVVLLGGPPGVGKSTLFLQVAGSFSKKGKKVLYISGEENPAQIKTHALRLGIEEANISVLSSSKLDAAEDEIKKNSPDIIVVDSIQAVAVSGESTAAGSVKQVKKSTAKLVSIAKNNRCVVFISGQITKQGSIAGPKILEHMVDAVAYMDVIDSDVRIVSTAKNRFGPCGDFLILKLTSSGLREQVQSPASKAAESMAGQAFVCVKTGARYQYTHIQALVNKSYFEYPLRRTSGFSRQRLLMLSAIASKHMKLNLGTSDIYLNAGGGLKIAERSADIGVLAALYSNIKDLAPPPATVFIGEAGLAGEVSGVNDIERRLKFAAGNSFEKAVVSFKNSKVRVPGIKLFPLKKVSELKDIIK
ncbi:MAG: ATPase domain-containing protein [Elusimicrobiota bacterium]